MDMFTSVIVKKNLKN